MSPPLTSRIPSQRAAELPQRPRPRTTRRVPDDVYALGYRICADGWQKAVAAQLAGAMNRHLWAQLSRRPSGLCDVLAELATEVEDATTALGEAAGLAVGTAVRWFGLPRLAQKVAQVVVKNAVPPVGEQVTTTLARCLRVVGIWICLGSGRSLETCACFAGLVKDRTRTWIEESLTRELSCLRPVSAV